MGTGYTRNDSPNNIADGNVINASDLDGEFDAIQSAFNGSTGHSHDGTTGEGPQIDTAGLADGAVTTDKLGADAVTGAKIGDDQIDSEHYVAGSIDREHLAADIIDGTKIADDVINSEHYVAGSIDNEHLADDAVTGAKIDSATTVTAASFVGPLTGNASTATALATGRTVSLTGDVTGTSGSFDGTGNVTITATVADDSHNHVVGNIDNFTESVQDIAGAMFSGNTESGITATYQDADGTIDLNVNDPTITLSGDVSGSATMTNLGNVTITTAVANDSHTHDGRYFTETESDARYLLESNNLSDLTSASTARTNLGLGTLATANTVNAATITDNSVGAAELNVSGNGSNGQVLASDGDGTFSWTTPSSGLSKTAYVYANSSTFTAPTGVNQVYVEVYGGGGAGGTAVGASDAGGGGGGGGGALSLETVTPGATYNITVGNAGGSSSFHNNVTANGGGAGSDGNSNGGTNNRAGGAGGTASGGNIVNITGRSGSAGIGEANLQRSTGGDGASPVHTGAEGLRGFQQNNPGNQPGTAGQGIGAGGGGGAAYASNADGLGGAGTKGLVVVHI